MTPSPGTVTPTEQQSLAQTIRTRIETAERIRDLLSGDVGYDDPESALNAYIEGLRSTLADVAPAGRLAAIHRPKRGGRPRRTPAPPAPSDPPPDPPADA